MELDIHWINLIKTPAQKSPLVGTWWVKISTPIESLKVNKDRTNQTNILQINVNLIIIFKGFFLFPFHDDRARN